ncbi:MAG: hypothetical protein M1820_002020 [Bogoriella megaspora]|nr:MAG: hypothetical protein M1820_002020 [Bogoriella megaspora]
MSYNAPLKSGLFPFVHETPPKPTSMAESSLYGGPCLHETGKGWSCCHMVQDDGSILVNALSSSVVTITGQPLQQASFLTNLAAHKEGCSTPIANPMKDAVTSLTTQSAAAANCLKPYTLSACRLTVDSSNLKTDLSGVWVKGQTRDIILTVSHFKKRTDVPATEKNTLATAYTSMTGSLTIGNPTICELYYDFGDVNGPLDFAVFVPRSQSDPRSPASALPTSKIMTEALPSTHLNIAISVGYNSEPKQGVNGHPDSRTRNDACSCVNCWFGSGNEVTRNLGTNMSSPGPNILVPDFRVVGIGKWDHFVAPGQILHTVTGWYGISGAGMYHPDGSGDFRLFALFQKGILEGDNSDKNGAVTIPRSVVDKLEQAGCA